MRDYQTFKDLGDIGILYQYLWMDENNTITFNNGLADLTIRMKDNQFVVVKNDNYPDLEETSYMDMLYPENLIGIIYYLDNIPPKRVGTLFRSRWEEIKTDVGVTVGLNKFNRRDHG